jgi:hypothetical protein
VWDEQWVIESDRVLISVVGLNRPSIQSVSGSTALVRAQNQGTTADEPSNVDTVNITLRNTQNVDEWQSYFDSQGFTNCNSTDTAIGCEYSPGSDPQMYVVYHDIFISIDP